MQTIDEAYREVCKLHEQITRAPAPEIGPQGFAPFPPGIDPVGFAIEEVSQLKRMFESAQTGDSRTVTWVPRASIYASETSVRYRVEIPDVSREEVSVSVLSGEMVVRGQRRPPVVDALLKPVMVEQAWGAFERRFPLPPWCEPDRIQARCSQGVLEIDLVRKHEGSTAEFHVEVS